jgi:hypothetical protein
VLEHPAYTKAWGHFGLAKPCRGEWRRCSEYEWTCEISQSAYGHAAQKRTWLYYVGVIAPSQMRWERPPATAHIGPLHLTPDGRRVPCGNLRRMGKIEALVTPPLFAEVLLSLARNACSGDAA